MSVISKELLKSVKNYNSVEDIKFFEKYSVIRVWVDECEWHMYTSLNVHTLMNECKLWAFDKGYEITSKPVESRFREGKTDFRCTISPTEYGENAVISNEEYEAVFEFCQRIIDKENGKYVQL